MTVGELRKALEGLPDDMLVVTDDAEGWPDWRRPVESASPETILTKADPYGGNEPWYWRIGSTTETHVGGTEMTAIFIW